MLSGMLDRRARGALSIVPLEKSSPPTGKPAGAP
jgi:hypothetical protein